MKKILSLVLALALCLSLGVVAFAASAGYAPYDSDGKISDDVVSYTWSGLGLGSTATLTLDPVRPATTVYMYLGDMGGKIGDIAVDDVVNTDFFKFSVDKDSNGKLVKKISVTDDKRLGSFERAAYLKIELNDMTDTDEAKSDGTIEFKAKADYTSYADKKSKPKTAAPGTWSKDDTLKIDYTFWISNIAQYNDDNPDVGDRVYMDPDKNDTNTLIWGDDRAALKFDADDDAKKFYARLSTSNMSDIYAEYGDPADADLWFYDFVGHPTIPATSKATLTLVFRGMTTTTTPPIRKTASSMKWMPTAIWSTSPPSSPTPRTTRRFRAGPSAPVSWAPTSSPTPSSMWPLTSRRPPSPPMLRPRPTMARTSRTPVPATWSTWLS